MSTDRWNRLSDWHNAWLAADPSARQRLRDDLGAASPELVAEADTLVAAAESLTGFLETPAFVITAARMAVDDAGFAPGTLVGPYRITSLIARGGMGIVYRATDTRLDREIALKMVATAGRPDEHAVDRFLREARITASLDHPNVVKVFDVGMRDGQPFMVVELLDGETLRQTLDRGPISEAETRRIGIEIARGLIAASAAGLVHRDLKPENIFLTRAGVTKVLDFGIAKLAPDGARRRAGSSTLTGILLGTAGYLAPEQIQGGEADGRADLFALGSILFEMLTGQRAFAAENTVDTLHAILHEPAPDLATYRADVSSSLEAIVTRLLQKSPANRFQTAADLVWALEQGTADRVRVAPPVDSQTNSRPRSSMGSWRWAAAIALPLLLLAAWGTGRRSRGDAAVDLARFNWALPTAAAGLWSAPAVSPDGRRVVWAAYGADKTPQLFVRALSADEATLLAGTAGARQPFWSPDGKSIGFFARGKLKKIAAAGGPVTEIADAPDAKGGTWGPNGVMLFQSTYHDSPITRVSDQGGATTPVTVLDVAQDDVAHRWPVFLPDGRHFLYQSVSPRDDRRGVFIGTIDGPPAVGRLLFPSDVGAIYVPGVSASEGFLLSAGSGGVEVRSFDVVRLVVTGDTRSIAVPAAVDTPHHPALLNASSEMLAFGASAIPFGFRLGRVDRDGSNLILETENQLGGFPRLSPDGRFLARCRVDFIRSNPDIWVDDLERGTTLRLTTSSQHDVMPIWSPDGTEVAYRSGTLDRPTIAFAAADGSGVKKTVACPESPCDPNDWSPDGQFLILTVRGRDLWTLPLASGEAAHPLLSEPFVERDARISPDGKWLAYVSEEAGRPEVSVRSLTGPARRVVVTKGGDQPVWRHDGRELFFTGADGRVFVSAVRPAADGGLLFGDATKLGVPPLGERHWGTIYDVSHDGRYVYFLAEPPGAPPANVGVVMGWRHLIK
ncbi:MAG TPA: protein kinase [Vicinamibacterales bacterium]|nr:protein kinase [Vicinamibacterales bacterium]